MRLSMIDSSNASAQPADSLYDVKSKGRDAGFTMTFHAPLLENSSDLIRVGYAASWIAPSDSPDQATGRFGLGYCHPFAGQQSFNRLDEAFSSPATCCCLATLKDLPDPA